MALAIYYMAEVLSSGQLPGGYGRCMEQRHPGMLLWAGVGVRGRQRSLRPALADISQPD